MKMDASLRVWAADRASAVNVLAMVKMGGRLVRANHWSQHTAQTRCALHADGLVRRDAAGDGAPVRATGRGDAQPRHLQPGVPGPWILTPSTVRSAG